MGDFFYFYPCLVTSTYYSPTQRVNFTLVIPAIICLKGYENTILNTKGLPEESETGQSSTQKNTEKRQGPIRESEK
jgi:hypothetical protein